MTGANVLPVGEHFVAAGQPWPDWYQGAPELEKEAPCSDTILTVWPDGSVLRHLSRGADHQ